MGKIVLLAMAAAWAAVLIPPLLRSRVDSRPNSSISDFRRHLSTLQRTVPTQRVAPMRAMARPLAQTQTRSSARVAPATRGSLQTATRQHGPSQHGPATRQHGPREHDRSAARRPAERRPERRPAPQLGQREMVRRRRMHALFGLLLATGVSLFLAATTKNTVMIYAFAIAFMVLCGYCYKLAQLRAAEDPADDHWYRAA